MRSHTDGAVGLVVILLYLLCVYGWVVNIVHLAHAAAFSPMVALRIVGIIVAPLGVVLGFIS